MFTKNRKLNFDLTKDEDFGDLYFLGIAEIKELPDENKVIVSYQIEKNPIPETKTKVYSTDEFFSIVGD